MYYDSKGRIVQQKSTNHLGGVDNTYFSYTFTGSPKKMLTEHTTSQNATTTTELYSYTYDHAGRLIEEKHQLNNLPVTVLAKNEYDELGRLKSIQKADQVALKTNYAYNIRSWTKSITSQLFSQSLYYNEHQSNVSNFTPSYSGNISAIYWMGSINRGVVFSSFYTYDHLSRLTNARHLGRNTSVTETFGYDKQGNMDYLRRSMVGGITGSGSQLIDNLTFSYTGNQIKSISESGSEIDGFLDFTNLSTEYRYNANGAMTQDLNKGISNIQYNYLNLPRQIDIKSPVAEAINKYLYSADGRKLSVQQRWSSDYSTSPVMGSTVYEWMLDNINITNYIGNKIYKNGLLNKILVNGGYYDTQEHKYYFFLTDHLGNNRIMADASGNVIQDISYLAFGNTDPMNNYGEGVQPYKYNGKEADDMHGLELYDYSARYHDANIGRFTTMDPLAEKYYNMSPYAYCANNPIKYVDYRGDSISLAGMQGLDQALNTNYTQTIVNDLNSQTGLTITVSADGKMSYAKDANGNPIITTTKDANGNMVQVGSATARTFMTGAIDHPDMVNVSSGAKSGVPTGTNDIGLNFKQIEGFINGTVGADTRTLGWGMTVMHELYHTQVGGGLADTPGTPGPVVTQMNIIRAELGENYGQRLDYQATPIGGSAYIPFVRASKESIILGIPPSTVRPGQKYIKF